MHPHVFTKCGPLQTFVNCPTLNVDPETRVIVGLLFNMESSDEGEVHSLTLRH